MAGIKCSPGPFWSDDIDFSSGNGTSHHHALQTLKHVCCWPIYLSGVREVWSGCTARTWFRATGLCSFSRTYREWRYTKLLVSIFPTCDRL
jgi:hypothetical protein